MRRKRAELLRSRIGQRYAIPRQLSLFCSLLKLKAAFEVQGCRLSLTLGPTLQSATTVRLKIEGPGCGGIHVNYSVAVRPEI
jgi:hypothetical protein